LIVDDHELIRLGVNSLLASSASGQRLLPLLEAENLADALDLYAQHQDSLALVLLDLGLPDAHGLSGLREFLARFPGAHIGVLSGDGDPALQQQALQTGARAWLSKNGQLTQVLAYLFAQGLLGTHPPEGSPPNPAVGIGKTARVVRTHNGEHLNLTQRQARILDQILMGQSNSEIAQHMYLAEGTVKNHVSTLLLMFGARSRAQLISRLR
jgi:DNA-binding NarL/FixJ family response regulator